MGNSLDSDHGGTVIATARKIGVDPESILDFSASINPLGISETVYSAIVDSISNIIHYPDNSHFTLSNILSQHHSIATGCFTVGNGSTELIYSIPAMLANGRNKALLIAPAFSEYSKALLLNNWQVEYFILNPANLFAIDVARLAESLSFGYDVLFLCNPGNPTGRLYSQDVVRQIMDVCINSGTFLVIDEAFMDFCEEYSMKQTVTACDNAILLRSMTKFYGIPGLRLGYAISSEKNAGRLAQVIKPWSVNTLAMAAGVAALQDESYSRRTLEYNIRERCYLCDGLTKIQQLKVYESSANYLLVEIVYGNITLKELCSSLLSDLIMVRDCSTFVGLSDRFFRVAVRSNEDNRRLLVALAKLFSQSP